jgi:LCP family protein required for cell wall assembly
MVNVPLGNGDVYGPKLNSLLSFAERNPKTFPKGGMRTLEDAVGTLLGIPIHYYARIDFIGFIAMVDAVGGVDIDVKRTLRAKHYDGYGLTDKGFRLTKGMHHLTGAEALAYARIRKGRRDRLHAGRLAAGGDRRPALERHLGGSPFWRLPTLLDAVASTIRTDVPTARLPSYCAVDEVARAMSCAWSSAIRRAAAKTPGSSQVPNLARSRRSPPGCSRHPAPADPVADAKGDQGPEAGPTPGSRAPPAEPLQGAGRSGSRRRARDGGDEPSATAWSSQRAGVPVARRTEQPDRFWYAARARPRCDLGQLLQGRAFPAAEAVRGQKSRRFRSWSLDDAQVGRPWCASSRSTSGADDADHLPPVASARRRARPSCRPAPTVDDADPSGARRRPRRELRQAGS